MINRISKKYFLLAVSGTRIGNTTDLDIAVRCPICGDSHTKKNSTRLHLYHKNGSDFVGCFNGDCPCVNKNVYSFLRDFYPALLANYKRESFSNTIKHLGDSTGNVFDKVKTVFTVITQDLSMYLTDLREAPNAIQYLENRKLPYKENFGRWFYGHQNLKIGEITYPITGAIVIPLYYKDEMYGFYSRSITDKSFYTYMDDRNIGFKVWNWFNIDKSKEVYIFEGIFDAISSGLTNCIALLGAKLPEERLKELKKPVFVLDNDVTGLHNSLKYALQFKSVYVQPDKYTEKDMNELLLNNEFLNIKELIKQNIFVGISAEVRIKSKL